MRTLNQLKSPKITAIRPSQTFKESHSFSGLVHFVHQLALAQCYKPWMNKQFHISIPEMIQFTLTYFRKIYKKNSVLCCLLSLVAFFSYICSLVKIFFFLFFFFLFCFFWAEMLLYVIIYYLFQRHVFTIIQLQLQKQNKKHQIPIPLQGL